MIEHCLEPEVAVVAPTTRYLLCRGPRVEGCAGRISAFETEKEARVAFMRAYQDRSCRTGWAQVIAIDSDGSLRVLSWFGRPSAPLVPEAK